MNSLRFSGSACALTCSALTVVPRMTNMSTPASTTVFANSLVRWGLRLPATAIAFGEFGGLGVLNLEGLWTRYDDPTDLLEEVAGLTGPDAIERMQEIYTEPIRAELITERIRQVRDAGVTVSGSLSPQRTKEFAKTVVDAGC